MPRRVVVVDRSTLFVIQQIDDPSIINNHRGVYCSNKVGTFVSYIFYSRQGTRYLYNQILDPSPISKPRSATTDTSVTKSTHAMHTPGSPPTMNDTVRERDLYTWRQGTIKTILLICHRSHRRLDAPRDTLAARRVQHSDDVRTM